MENDLFKDHNYFNTSHLSLQYIKAYARIVNVHDGDTITVIMNIFNGYYKLDIRLIGIDTCEMNSKLDEAKKLAINARNRILQLIGINININEELTSKDIIKFLNDKVYILWIECGDNDKYGRILANVFINNESIGDILIKEHLAIKYDGGTKLSEEEQIKILTAFNL